MNLDRGGYPFYVEINGLTSEIISFHGNFRKTIWVTYPLIEIEIIKNWRPIGEIKRPIALYKERRAIIDAARNRLTNNYDDWDRIPF